MTQIVKVAIQINNVYNVNYLTIYYWIIAVIHSAQMDISIILIQEYVYNVALHAQDVSVQQHLNVWTAR